jgi:hypothetical protein
MDDQRIKEGRTANDGYFEELLERIRDIRASERLFYQKMMDIYATSIDYDAKQEITQTFFATVQNKLTLVNIDPIVTEFVKKKTCYVN